ncbi:hypothetical protein [Plantactinospora sp. KLBMP9567]|uniref:hypothetical protein n=1 Tax=Plantactinospora sp. KLBMP9567 TaxID=3085900 RepID=UPI0029816F0E|nr:hypothetical protein [Plantactinospora sp. KLBMP9567]MDW5323701.1 hypothetical protein [Plantactinospora sp. KLBMP9567]
MAALVLEAVDHVLGVAVRLARPEGTDASSESPVSTAEAESWWKQVERSTDVLAAYARILTSRLPAVRAAVDNGSGSDARPS